MAEIRQKLLPFTTPNFVRVELPPRPRQEGFVEAPAIPLSEVPADTLSELCDDFRAAVFRTARKNDPRYNEVGESSQCPLTP